MRKALSLIELIFTIVIIATVFTVIPKIVFSLNKADSFNIRQDAIFNGISMMKMNSKLPWDEGNVGSRDILDTNSTNSIFDCNKTTFRRVGGFIGGRTCEHNLSASVIAQEGNVYNDIDDYDDYDENTTNVVKYGLHVSVRYLNENISYNNKRASIYIDYENVLDDNNRTNLKYVDTNITYQGKRGKQGRALTQFKYISSNIGQMILNKRTW